jgi:hypothetical protein
MERINPRRVSFAGLAASAVASGLGYFSSIGSATEVSACNVGMLCLTENREEGTCAPYEPSDGNCMCFRPHDGYYANENCGLSG